MPGELINADNFCSLSGIGGVNKLSAVKLFGRTKKKTYSEWFKLFTEKAFAIPKNLCKRFSEKEISKPKISKSKEILKKVGKNKNK